MKNKKNIYFERIENELHVKGYRNIKDILEIIDPFFQECQREWFSKGFRSHTDLMKDIEKESLND